MIVLKYNLSFVFILRLFQVYGETASTIRELFFSKTFENKFLTICWTKMSTILKSQVKIILTKEINKQTQ